MSAGAEPGISGDIISTVARVLAELGYAPAQLPAFGTGDRLAGPLADALFTDAAAALGEPAIGLAAARRMAPGALGLLDYALLTGSTWGEAITRVAKFYGVATDRATMAVQVDGDEARVVLVREEGYVQNRHWVEFTFGIIVERARQILPSTFRLRSVDVAHPTPPDPTTHERYFGVPVRFDQPQDRLAFDRTVLDAPLPTGAAVLADILEQRLTELVPAKLDSTMSRIRATVAECIDQAEVTLDSVAAKLTLSTRSLQRALQQRDVTFKELVDNMRRDRALILLRASEMSVAEVASRVGFADDTAFIRAFRRWTGRTPAAVRAEGDASALEA